MLAASTSSHCSPPSFSCSSDMQNLRSSYGLSAQASTQVHDLVSSQDLLSSQEQTSEAPPPAVEPANPEAEPASLSSSTPGQAVIEYFDNQRRKLVRSAGNGQLLEARMEPGEGGMAIATFDGELPKQTEVPNILVEPCTVRKRPASAAKQLEEAQEGEEEEFDEQGPAQDQAPDVSAQSAAAPKKLKSSARSLLYSKVYHAQRQLSISEGKSPEEAKQLGRDAANRKCEEAAAAGLL